MFEYPRLCNVSKILGLTFCDVPTTSKSSRDCTILPFAKKRILFFLSLQKPIRWEAIATNSALKRLEALGSNSSLGMLVIYDKDPYTAADLIQRIHNPLEQRLECTRSILSCAKVITISFVVASQKIPFLPSESELTALISGCGKKMATILQTLKETGMRIGELCSLKWTDINTESYTIILNTSEKTATHEYSEFLLN